MITTAKFKKATGYAPKDDDLDRCNCPRAGELGHTMCGWDHDMGQPVFIAKALKLKQDLEKQTNYKPNVYEQPQTWWPFQ